MDKWGFSLRTSVTIVVLLLLICTSLIYFIPKKPKIEYCKTISFPTEEKNGPSSCNHFSSIRKYVSFYLTDDSIKNAKVFIQIRASLNSIKANQDTINGVDIVLSKETSYKYFIQATDICSEKRPSVYASCKNHIYTFYVDTVDRAPKTESKLMRCY